MDTSHVFHNLVASDGEENDPAWTGQKIPIQVGGTFTYRFTKPGLYSFLCQVHASMQGTVTVTGDPVEPTPTPTTTPGEPTPTPTSTPPTGTPTPTPTADPGGNPPDDHTSTPRPDRRRGRGRQDRARDHRRSSSSWMQAQGREGPPRPLRDRDRDRQAQGQSKVAKSARLQVRCGDAADQAAATKPSRPATPSSSARATPRATAPPSRQPSFRVRRSDPPDDPFRPPADAWSRRDVMRNGMGSSALLCTLGASGHAQGRLGRHVRPQAVAGGLPLPAVPPRPADRARAQPRQARHGRRRLRRGHPRGAGRDPAGLPDADLRLRRALPGPDDPRPQGPDGGRAPAQQPVVRLQRPPARRLRARRARRQPDGRHRRGQLVRLLLPERPGRGVPLVPRPRARPHVADALLRPRRDLRPRRRARARARPAPGRVRRAAGHRRPLVQQGRLVPVRGERRPRVPRRHDPRQRRGHAADGGASAGSTGCGSSTPPTRAPTSCGSATAAR